MIFNKFHQACKCFWLNRHRFEWFAYFSSHFMDCTFFIYSLLKRLLLVLISNFSYKELDNSHKENIGLTRVRFVNLNTLLYVKVTEFRKFLNVYRKYNLCEKIWVRLIVYRIIIKTRLWSDFFISWLDYEQEKWVY